MDCVLLKQKILEKYGIALVNKIEKQMGLEYGVSFDTAPEEFVLIIYKILKNHISNDPESVLDDHKSGKHKITLETRTELAENILECMGNRNCLDILNCIADEYCTAYQIISHSGINRSNVYRKVELLESIGLLDKKTIHQSKLFSYTSTFESITITHHKHYNKIMLVLKNEKLQKKFRVLQKSLV